MDIPRNWPRKETIDVALINDLKLAIICIIILSLSIPLETMFIFHNLVSQIASLSIFIELSARVRALISCFQLAIYCGDVPLDSGCSQARDPSQCLALLAYAALSSSFAPHLDLSLLALSTFHPLLMLL